MAHASVITALAVFLARAHALTVVPAVLLTSFLIGSHLLLYFSHMLRNAIMGTVPPTVDPTSAWWLRAVFEHHKHLLDYGAFLLLSSLLLLVPSVLLLFLVTSGALSGLAALAQVALNWRRHARADKVGHRSTRRGT